jgi:hypothetical protein
MTAGSGILHEEFHSEAFSRQGGGLEMVQLWVNLPAKDKMTTPGYQTLNEKSIPAVDLPDNAGFLRVIAGEFDGHRGPARTFTPLDVWDVRMTQNGKARFDIPAGRTLSLVMLHGTLLINGNDVVREAQLVQFDTQDTSIELEANTDAVFLLLSGEPIDEPIVGHGPFVMNTQEEIKQAIDDFNSGRFGQMHPDSRSDAGH